MDKETVREQLRDYAEMTERAIDSYLPETECLQKNVILAARHSLTAGGKRLRPALVMEFCRVSGGEAASALPVACAIEMMHTFSLIHDDLPCMDNDDMRRGRPSCHKAFGEANALLAGDALAILPGEIIAKAGLKGTISQGAALKIISLLGEQAGIFGMIGGQVLDLKYEAADPSLQQLLTVHKLKTGALISAACILGCLAAGATQAQIAAASNFAYNLVIAFQIKDDILDITGTSEMLGKPVGSDSDQGKVTYATKVGLEKAQQDVELLTDKALESLRAFDDTDFLQALAQSLISRNH